MNQKKFSFFLSLIFFLLINNLFSAEKSVKKIKDNIEVYKTTKSKKQIKIIKDELVIKFKESVSESKKNNLLKTHKLTKLKRNQKLRNEKIKISTGKKVKDIIDILKKNKDIEYIEPNYVIEASEIANDSYYSEQWGLKKIEIEEAWKINEGENDVIIAVLDSGLDLAHLDLQANIKSGYDFVNDDADASDDNGHGSMVAGIIGAVKNNSIGISGVAPKCKIMPLKVLDSEGYGTYADVADAIIYAADNGAKVINLSLGGYAYSQYLQDAINYAFNKNCVIVASAGNNNTDEPFYPAACANVISVSSINKDNNKSTFANYGNYIDLVAPGEQIISCDLNNNY
ncbi:MAG TPA: S8 family serine peptidase, partial [bacterium]|nr:S8 family serine peptidase [bacterium]